MALKCNQCGKFVSASDGIKCVKCVGVYHRTCASLSPDAIAPVRWTCRGCKEKQPTVKIQEQAHKRQQRGGVEVEVTEESYAEADMEGPVRSLADEIRSLRNKLVTVTREMVNFRQEFVRLNETLAEFSVKIDEVEIRMKRVEEQVAERRENSDTHALEVIKQLKIDLNDREQENLLMEVEIAGLPERSGENSLQIVGLIATKLGVSLDSRDIVSAERSGSLRVLPEGSQRKRPRPMTVRLTRRALRDELLQAARVCRGADTSGIIDGDPSRFYINERLTRLNRQVFYQAREAARRFGWRHVWTRGGRILARRDTGASVNRIRSADDIEKVFGEGFICSQAN